MHTWFIWVCQIHHPDYPHESSHKAPDQDGGPSRREMGVFMRTEHAKYIIVFMHRLTKIPPFLLVPPVGVWIAELAGNWRWIDVTTVHARVYDVFSGEEASL